MAKRVCLHDHLLVRIAEVLSPSKCATSFVDVLGLHRKRDAIISEKATSMTEKDRADLENIAQRLKDIHDELNQLETRIGASAIEQAALSSAMALAWLELFLKTEGQDG